jgi:hypothetical protein
MIPIIAKEGIEGLRGNTCDDCSAHVAYDKRPKPGTSGRTRREETAYVALA